MVDIFARLGTEDVRIWVQARIFTADIPVAEGLRVKIKSFTIFNFWEWKSLIVKVTGIQFVGSLRNENNISYYSINLFILQYVLIERYIIRKYEFSWTKSLLL